jgi:hypothetical protein
LVPKVIKETQAPLEPQVLWQVPKETREIQETQAPQEPQVLYQVPKETREIQETREIKAIKAIQVRPVLFQVQLDQQVLKVTLVQLGKV